MMRRILSTALALSLLNGTAVLAQPNRDRDNRNEQSDRGRGDDRGDQNRGGQNRGGENRDDRRAGPQTGPQAGGSQARGGGPAPQSFGNRTPPPARDAEEQNRGSDFRNDPRFRDIQNNPSYRVANPRWSRGDRLPDRYRDNRYVVDDWQRRGLRPPPRNYHWVRDDDDNFFLAVIGSGIITDSYYRNDRDVLWREHYTRPYTYNDDIYYRECRSGPDPAGVIIGALIGGLLGNAVGSGGGRTGATLAGVIVGGAVGAALTSNLDCEDRSYAYKAYYDGFNAGRPGAVYRWRNPRNDHRGDFRVVDYYNDPYGFRCSNFSQTIYINGRPQEARGRACQQPDGTWAIVG